MKTKFLLATVVAAGMSLCGAMQAQGQVILIAKGDLNGPGTNPNQFFVFGFTDADLAGSVLVLQQPQGSAKKD